MEIDNIKNRHIRVFVSSTFRDMQEEREYLREKVYPELRVEFARRYVDLTFIDLTWGVTEEQSKSGRTMEICLRQIEKSRPFFIGILGSRYGTFPKIDFLEMNPHLKDWTWLPKDIEDELSNTEIEIQYGALRPEEKTHAFFYFCKEDRPTGESKEADARQKCLKETIIKDKRYPVSYYSTPEEFGLLVKENLKGLFNQLFPPLQLPEMELEDELQDFFLKFHTRAYVPAGDYLNDIDKFVENTEQRGLVITGAPGMGKSALVANWLSSHENDGALNIICHFVGAGNLQGKHTKIAERLSRRIKQIYGFSDVNAEEQKDPVKMLSEYIWKASEREPQLVIVIDGINQIKDEDNAKLLTWLIYSHKNVKYILTTLKEDRTMERPRRENYVQLEIKPLNVTHNKDQREEMAVCYLDYFGQQLSDTQRNLFCSDDKCRNPLILKSLLDELRVIGIHEKLTDQIESYLATSDINGFFQKIIAHYEAAFGLKQVKTVLGLVAYSRDGMREEELREISGIEGSDWYQLFGTIYNHLIYRNGLWAFNNSYILEAVRSRYGSPKTFRREIVKYMEKASSVHFLKEREERQLRCYEELPYQYWQLKDYGNLYNYIILLDVFEYVYDRHVYELAEYWRKFLETGEDKYSFNYLTKETESNIETVYYCNKIGNFAYLYLASFDKALDYYKYAINIQERLLGNNHPSTATLYNNLGLVYKSMGEYTKALEYYKKDLSISEILFGPDHPSTAITYNNLGLVYDSMGDYPKALEYHNKDLSICEKNLGTYHPNTATSYNNLGGVYDRMGDYPKALEYYEKALAILEEVLGLDHPSTAASYNNLGLVYKSMGDYPKALEYYNKALSILEKVFGSDHTDTAISYNNLGGVYYGMGDYPKALDYYNKDLSLCEKVLGPDHPSTAASYNNLGGVCNSMGDYPKALEYYNKALSILKKVLDPDHSDTATTYSNIGLVYKNMGNYPKALEYYNKALAIREKVLGPAHPDSAILYNNFGGVYDSMGDYPKALEYYNKALSIREEVFDPDHPSTSISYNNLGGVYFSMENYPKALEYYNKALAIREKVLGPYHPSTATLYNNIGLVYKNMGDYSKALEYYNKALFIREKVLDPDHPSIATLYNNIGLVYKSMGDYPKALEYYNMALSIFEKVLDPDHPSTATQYNNIGNIYYKKRDFEEALIYHKKALDIRLKILGSDHPDTQTSYYNIGVVYDEMGLHALAKEYYDKAKGILK